MEHKDCYINVIALSEVLLENNKSKLEFVSDLIIENVGKDDKIIKKEIKKEDLTNELVKTFDGDVSSLKVINIKYIKNNTEINLSEINIF